jgi:hypothetical protein
MSHIETNETPVSGFCTNTCQHRGIAAARRPHGAADEVDSTVRGISPALVILSLRLDVQFSPQSGAALDALAPENELLFVLRGNQFIHPATGLPFPYETIASAVTSGTDAVFCHRYQAESVSGGRAYRIRTALLGEIDADPVVIGSFGAERPNREPVLERAFEAAIESLRSCWQQADEIVQYIRAVLQKGSRVVVVDQSADQVVFASPGASGDTEAAISDVAGSIRDLLTAGGQLRQYTLAGTPLAIVAVTNPKETPEPPRRAFEDYAFHTVRNSLSAIASAATFLEDQLPDRACDNMAEFTTLITQQSLRINALIEQVELLRSPSHPEPTTLGLGEATADLEARLSGTMGRPQRQTALSGESDAFRFETCRRYWGALTSAVALLHRNHNADPAQSRLTCRPGPRSDSAVIDITTVSTDVAQTSAVEPGIVDFIERAAERTGSRVTVDCNTSSLTTQIEIRRCNLTGDQ